MNTFELGTSDPGGHRQEVKSTMGIVVYKNGWTVFACLIYGTVLIITSLQGIIRACSEALPNPPCSAVGMGFADLEIVWFGRFESLPQVSESTAWSAGQTPTTHIFTYIFTHT